MNFKNKIIIPLIILAGGFFATVNFSYAEIAKRNAEIILQSIAEEQNKIVELSPRSCYLTSRIEIKNKVKAPLQKMILEAEKDDMCLIVLSGYRTNERQWIIYNSARDKSIVAYPGTSEHEKGIAVDFGGCPMIDGTRNDAGERLELRNDFNTLPEYQWLLDNAQKYGFEQSYTEGNMDQTGKPAEPWHWKYIY